MQVPPLNEADQKKLVKEPRVAELATVGPDGTPRITPIWFQAQDDGSFLMSTWENTGAAKNVKANPRCALMIDQAEAFPYWGVHYVGTAKVEGPENDVEGIAKMFTPYIGSLDNAREYAQTLVNWGKRVYLRFTPEKTTSWDFRQG